MTIASPGASLDARTDPWLLAALMAAVAVIGAALFALSPLLPDIARDLGVPIAQAGRLPAIYSFSLAISAPVIALMARDWSRARVLSGALLTFGLAWCAPLLLRSHEAMMGVTLLAGASAGAALPAAYALAADVSAPGDRARVMGRTVAGWSVAILGTAPLIAAFAQWLDWRVAFALLGAASWAAWAMLRRGLSRQHARAVPGAAVPASDLRASIATVAGHRRTRLLLLANLLDMGAFFSVYAYLGTQLRAANGWGPTLAGLTLACYGIGLALASLNGRLIDRVGALRSARATLLVLVVVLATLPWLADRPWLMAIGMVAWGLVQGGFFTAITALASDQLPALRGVVTALLSGSTYLGVALYAPAAGALYGSQGLWAVGLLSAAGCLLAALALRRL